MTVLDEPLAPVSLLAAGDVRELAGPQLRDRVLELVRLRNEVDAQLTLAVRAAECSQMPELDGLKSMASWLKGHTNLSPAVASRIVRSGRALEQLPAVTEAFTAGDVTADQVALIAKITTPENLAAAQAQGIDLADTDTSMADTATEVGHERTDTMVDAYLDRLDPDGPEPDPTDQRALTVSRFGAHGWAVRGFLDDIGGEALLTALESKVQADRPAGDLRSRSQRMADALVQLADTALASGQLPELRRIKPRVVVTIPRENAIDPAKGPATATTGFGTQVSAHSARRIACDGEVTWLELDANGMPLNVGHTERIVPPHIRRALEARDKTCVFAGCRAPKYWCESHHIIHWLFGGETSLDNSALLCERHHTKVHHGFTIARDPDGRWHTYRPDGTEILIGTLLPA